jgi:hypothetical protein
MLLGNLLCDLQDGALAMQTLVEMNDLAMLTRIRNNADLFGETAGEYAANSVRRFANQANDEDWLVLMAGNREL